MTLVAGDGSLVSLVKLFGSRQIIGDAEYQWIVDQSTLKLGSRFDRPGYAMQFYFSRDSSMVGQDIDRVMKSNRSAMRAMEIDLEDLLANDGAISRALWRTKKFIWPSGRGPRF